MRTSAVMLTFVDALIWCSPSTEATTTFAPARRKTSIIIMDSISSLPLAMGINTFFSCGGISVAGLIFALKTWVSILVLRFGFILIREKKRLLPREVCRHSMPQVWSVKKGSIKHQKNLIAQSRRSLKTLHGCQKLLKPLIAIFAGWIPLRKLRSRLLLKKLCGAALFDSVTGSGKLCSVTVLMEGTTRPFETT